MTGWTQGIFMCANTMHIRESVQDLDNQQQQASIYQTARCMMAALLTAGVGWMVIITACTSTSTSGLKVEICTWYLPIRNKYWPFHCDIEMDGKATYKIYNNTKKMSKYKLFANLQSFSQFGLSFFWVLNALRTQKHLICLQHSKLENLMSDKPQTRTWLNPSDWMNHSVTFNMMSDTFWVNI
jgi:hypothetical protein